jgi:hypothetical protein
MALQVGVTGGQHRGKPRGLFLAAAAFAGLFKMPMAAHHFERAFTVDFLFEPAKGFFYGFAFFQFNFGQNVFTSSPGDLGSRAGQAKRPLESGWRGYFAIVICQWYYGIPSSH